MTTKRRLIKHLPILIAGFAMGLGVFSYSKVSKQPEVQEVDAIGNYSTDATSYYNGITATSGQRLAAQLHDLITSTHRYYTSYADNGANGYQKQTDRYYEDGSPVSGYIYEFYSGVKWPDSWAPNAGDTSGGYNREHCWCQSNSVNASGKQMWGESGGGADMHHLRPVETRLNSTRSNNVYGEISARDSYKVYAKLGTNTTYALGGYNNGGTFEPLDSKKGDVARIILYTYLHYNSYTNTTLFGSYGTTNGDGSSSYFTSSLLSLTKTTNQTTEAKALEMLLEWNAEDPVDEIEQRRNEKVSVYQGNRNPFIDNSNYAEAIWGTGGNTPTVHSVTVTPSTLDLDLNGTKTGNLSATVSVSNGAATTVTWSSSNTNVATVSSSGVVTAVAKGSCSITATSTANPNKSASCSVKVTDSSSSGGGGTTGNTYTIGWGTATGSAGTYTNFTTTSGSVEGILSFSSAKNGAGSDPAHNASDSELRLYYSSSGNGGSVTLTPESGITITSAVMTTSTSPSVKYSVNGGTATSVSASSNTYTISNIQASTSLSIQNVNTTNTQLRIKKIALTYDEAGSSSTATLSSISLNTSNVQTEFYENDTFDFSGLVVTAHYSDGTEDIVTPTSVSSPNMSSAGTKTVTITYKENDVTKTATYDITVLAAEVTEISASVNKIYHPGETISSSDIYVEDDFGNQVTGFTFSNNNYRFTYDDAASGGELTNKIFEDAVTKDNLSCSLTVQVQRKAFIQPVSSLTDVLTRESTGVPDQTEAEYKTYTYWENVAGTSGAVFAGQSAGDKDCIQLRSNNSNSGIIQTTSGGNPTRVSVVWHADTYSSRTLNVYGKNTAYENPTDLYESSTQGTLIGTITKSSGTYLNISGSYQYIGLRSESGAMYLSSISITYAGRTSDALNVSNYVMYEDTKNQCLSKLTTAVGYLHDLDSTERAKFVNPTDYVIVKAKERLNAWAASQGKTIDYSGGSLSPANHLVGFRTQENDNSTIIMLVLISMVGLSTITACLYIRKKRSR